MSKIYPSHIFKLDSFFHDELCEFLQLLRSKPAITVRSRDSQICKDRDNAKLLESGMRNFRSPQLFLAREFIISDMHMLLCSITRMRHFKDNIHQFFDYFLIDLLLLQYQLQFKVAVALMKLSPENSKCTPYRTQNITIITQVETH